MASWTFLSGSTRYEDAGIDERRSAAIAEGEEGWFGAKPEVHGEHTFGGGVAGGEEVVRALGYEQSRATQLGDAGDEHNVDVCCDVCAQLSKTLKSRRRGP
eukprot:scaffold4647_cov146-Isochrysis_galbana.AAC.1